MRLTTELQKYVTDDGWYMKNSYEKFMMIRNTPLAFLYFDENMHEIDWFCIIFWFIDGKLFIFYKIVFSMFSDKMCSAA